MRKDVHKLSFNRDFRETDIVQRTVNWKWAGKNRFVIHSDTNRYSTAERIPKKNLHEEKAEFEMCASK